VAVVNVLFLASVPLGVIAASGLSRTLKPTRTSRIYRTSLLTIATPMALIWGCLYVGHRASLSDLLLSIVGAFAGGVVTTSSAIGFVEDNAPPPPGVREKVLAHHSSGNLHCPRRRRFKRTLDVALASLGLIVTLPLWFLIAFAIWFEDPGPIFFTKNSVGVAGVTFRQLKFRSMRYDAERTTGPIASCVNDPRALRCGRWLRRWHLDELPELVNVLAGTMSMVGPRPLRTVLVLQYLEELPRFAERHTVKPGIACIAQIEKYYMPAAERLRKDLAYIRRMSIGLDLRLLCRAVLTTARGTRRWV
jgi:lipopolysaccharide/colanic/teichoic acid biosynthesis glycosyltransferase